MIQKTPNLINHLKVSSENSEKNNRKDNVVDLFCQFLKGEKKFQGIFAQCLINHEAVLTSIENIFEALPELFENEKGVHEYLDILAKTQELCTNLDNGFIDSEHVLHEMLISSTTINGWIEIAELSDKKDQIVELLSNMIYFKDKDQSESPKEINPEEFPTIDRFCEDMLDSVAEKNNSIFGRKSEIEQILSILCRKGKRNVMMIGEPGVGRKSIVRGVAERVFNGEVSEILQEKAFYSLDISSISAGASLMGSLEQRFKSLHKELDKHKNVVLVIDDFHHAYGTGGKEGSTDCASLLKSILTSKNVSCIAITTQKDYKQTIEKDSNLSNLFEKLYVKEPSKSETKNIVTHSISEVEEFHGVSFPEKTIDVIIDLCDRHLSYQKFPAKALNFIDQLGASAANIFLTQPESLLKEMKKVEACFEKHGVDSPKLAKQMQIYGNKLSKWLKNLSDNKPIISPETAIKEFSSIYDISENQLKQASGHSLNTLAERIKTHVFEQDEAVDKVVDVLLCSKVGLRDAKKPLGKFLFVGPSSVGKTELGKQIAIQYFGDSRYLLKLDMSEFSEKGSSSSLIGAPPGYIGHEAGGRLTEYVKNNPACVILFDEIEKADNSVHNLLLQVMDEGRLTDSHGTIVDFTNSIIILTSNSGSEIQRTSLGFNPENRTVENHSAAIKKDFRPEFRARVDEIIVFNHASDLMTRRIINKSLDLCRNNLMTQGIGLTIDSSVEDHLFWAAKKEDSHARNIHAIVRRELEIPLAKHIIANHPEKIEVKYSNKLEIV